jgi:hypothetical protein
MFIKIESGIERFQWGQKKKLTKIQQAGGGAVPSSRPDRQDEANSSHSRLFCEKAYI